jgi:uncharacterized membrane protein
MNTLNFDLTGAPLPIILVIFLALAICVIAFVVENFKSEKMEKEKEHRDKLQAIQKNMAKTIYANMNLQHDAFEARKKMIYEAFKASCEKPPAERVDDEDEDWRQQ